MNGYISLDAGLIDTDDLSWIAQEDVALVTELFSLLDSDNRSVLQGSSFEVFLCNR